MFVCFEGSEDGASIERKFQNNLQSQPGGEREDGVLSGILLTPTLGRRGWRQEEATSFRSVHFLLSGGRGISFVSNVHGVAWLDSTKINFLKSVLCYLLFKTWDDSPWVWHKSSAFHSVQGHDLLRSWHSVPVHFSGHFSPCLPLQTLFNLSFSNIHSLAYLPVFLCSCQLCFCYKLPNSCSAFLPCLIMC